MTNLRRFSKATIHTGDQPGPPSPYVGERSHAAKMSSGTSKFPVGNAQKQCAFEMSNRKVNPIGGDGPIDVNWMGGKDNPESSRPRYRIDRNEENQGRLGLDYWRRSSTVCHCRNFRSASPSFSKDGCTHTVKSVLRLTKRPNNVTPRISAHEIHFCHTKTQQNDSCIKS